jgi:hypothetical protein
MSRKFLASCSKGEEEQFAGVGFILGIGSDLAEDICAPSSFCGIYGFNPVFIEASDIIYPLADWDLLRA